MQKHLYIYFLVSLFLSAVYLALVADPLGSAAGRIDIFDDTSYFSQAASLANDGDLNLDNQPFRAQRCLQTGHIAPTHTLGTSIMMMPFYLLGTPAAQIISLVTKNPYNPLHPIFFSLVSAGMVLYLFGAGLVLLFALTKKWNPAGVLIAIILVFWGTFLPFYVFRRPFLSHIPDIFISSLLLAYCMKTAGKTCLQRRDMVILGILAAGTVIVRWQNLNLFIMGTAMALGAIGSGKKLTGKYPRVFYPFLFLASAFVLFMLTQGAAWIYYLGQIFPLPLPEFIGPDEIGINLRNLGHIFWGDDRGVIWIATPLLIGLIGFIVRPAFSPFSKKMGAIMTRLLFLGIIAWPFLIILQETKQSPTYGYRYLTGLIPLAVAGLAGLFRTIETRRLARIILIILTILFVLSALMLMIPYHHDKPLKIKTQTGENLWDNKHYLKDSLQYWQKIPGPGVKNIFLGGYLGWFTNKQTKIQEKLIQQKNYLCLPPDFYSSPDKRGAANLYPLFSLIFISGTFFIVIRHVKRTYD